MAGILVGLVKAAAARRWPKAGLGQANQAAEDVAALLID